MTQPYGLLPVRRLAVPHEFVVANQADVEVGRSAFLPAAVACARRFGVGATVRVRGQVVVLVIPTEKDEGVVDVASFAERETLVDLALGGAINAGRVAGLVRRGLAEAGGGGLRITPAGVGAALTPRMWDVLGACAHGRVEWLDNGSTGGGAVNGVPVGGQLNSLVRLRLIAVAQRAWLATERGALLLALRDAGDARST